VRQVRVRAIIQDGGELLLVKHRGHEQSEWRLPGGGLDDRETLQDGIRREVIEELGIEPAIGPVFYIHQLFLRDGTESLEFFFNILNAKDFRNFSLESTTHGMIEIARAKFMMPESGDILPDFLAEIDRHRAEDTWPKVYVSKQTAL
jgi:ADP-ribose pyrophosphatase YjhB (NUDIX family)